MHITELRYKSPNITYTLLGILCPLTIRNKRCKLSNNNDTRIRASKIQENDNEIQRKDNNNVRISKGEYKGNIINS